MNLFCFPFFVYVNLFSPCFNVVIFLWSIRSPIYPSRISTWPPGGWLTLSSLVALITGAANPFRLLLVRRTRFGWMKLLWEIHSENDHYLHEYFCHVQIFMNMNLWTMALGTEFVNMWLFCCPHLFLQEMGATFEHRSMTLNTWMFVELC